MIKKKNTNPFDFTPQHKVKFRSNDNNNFNNPNKIKFYKDKTYFIPLGGSSEIGRNLNVIGCNNKWIVMDLGVSFYKEMGIDITMADISFLDDKNVVAILITHGHEDHIGAITYLIDHINAPIYATKFTIELIMEKIKEENKLSMENIDLRVVTQGDKFQVANDFLVEYIPITHSILESSMIYIKTPTISFLNTGDWKFDATPGLGKVSNLQRLQEIGNEGLDFLLCDTTNVITESASGSEAEVLESLKKVLKNYPNKRIIFTSFASNVGRMNSCKIACEEFKRKIFMEGRSTKRIYGIAQRNGYLLGDTISTLSYEGFPHEKTFIICTGCQGEPASFLRRFVKGNKIIPGKDLIIFSSRAIPSNTQDIIELKNMIISQGGDVLCGSDPTFFEEREERQSGDHKFKSTFFSTKDLKLHVSGHASSEEVYELLKLVKPKILIPGYGDAYHMYYMAKLAKSVNQKFHISANGSVFLLEPDHIKLIKKINVPIMGVDGNNIVALDSEHIMQRKKISEEGIVCLTIPQMKNESIDLKKMRLTILGISHNQEIFNEISEEIKGFISKTNSNKPGNRLSTINEFVQSVFLQKTGKLPIVVVHQ